MRESPAKHVSTEQDNPDDKSGQHGSSANHRYRAAAKEVDEDGYEVDDDGEDGGSEESSEDGEEDSEWNGDD